jgi:threonine/homoserine/homoserine lactone efflux protein
MSLQLYLAFVAACIALALLPGPIVTLLIANGLRHGTRAALTNILGVQAGLLIVIGVLAVGLTSLMATMGYWFDWVRFAGAAYLVWLGIKLIRFPVEGVGVDADAPPPPPRGGFFLQGFVVALSNPKLLVFFGAFIPQFMDMSKDHLSQVLLLGFTFMVLAGLTDGIYALLAGRARKFFSTRRTRLVSRVSGSFMISGGIWLALTRARP